LDVTGRITVNHDRHKGGKARLNELLMIYAFNLFPPIFMDFMTIKMSVENRMSMRKTCDTSSDPTAVLILTKLLININIGSVTESMIETD
jgi:hypothetical protein